MNIGRYFDHSFEYSSVFFNLFVVFGTLNAHKKNLRKPNIYKYYPNSNLNFPDLQINGRTWEYFRGTLILLNPGGKTLILIVSYIERNFIIPKNIFTLRTLKINMFIEYSGSLLISSILYTVNLIALNPPKRIA